MQLRELETALEGILFAAGEPISAQRISQVLGVENEALAEAADTLKRRYETEDRGIRLSALDGSYQLCSAPELSDVIARAIEQRSPPKLSQASLEVLAVVAYYQRSERVTRAYIERVRGVDSYYSIGVLLDRGLIRPGGRAEVPGRPTYYETGENFLRVMGISNLDELPPLPDVSSDEGIAALRERINALSQPESELLDGQLEIKM